MSHWSGAWESAYWLSFAAWGSLELGGGLVRRRKARRPDAIDRDARSYALVIAGLLLGLFAAVQVARSVPAAGLGWSRAPVLAAAAGVIWLGIAFRWHAIATLGRYFTNDVAVTADQQVVQSGLYRLVRHPSYTGTLISIAGIGLGLLNWLSLVAALAGYLIGHLYRMRVEERALLALIGKPYEDYMRRTRRLIPFVY